MSGGGGGNNIMFREGIQSSDYTFSKFSRPKREIALEVRLRQIGGYDANHRQGEATLQIREKIAHPITVLIDYEIMISHTLIIFYHRSQPPRTIDGNTYSGINMANYIIICYYVKRNIVVLEKNINRQLSDNITFIHC